MNAPTREEFDNLAKSVKAAAELIKAGTNEETVREIVKTALAAHPGITPERKIQFAGNRPTRTEDVLDSMPKELQKKIDGLFLMSKILNVSPKSLKSWGGFVDSAKEWKKALDTADAAGGGDWVPTNFTSELAGLVRIGLRVSALFPSVRMPSNPYKLPIQIGRLASFKHDEQTANTGQTKIPVGDAASLTANTILTAVGHASRVLTSKDVEEDAIIPILPFLMGEIATALAEGREEAVMGGDTNATHEDVDVTAGDDRRKMWLGLRAHANDQTYKTDLATFNLTNVRDLRAQMGKYGVRPADMALICSIKGFNRLLDLGEVTTVEKYGALATILSGELGRIDGIPVVVSEFVREDLNATGIYDGVTTTKTAIHLVNRNAFVFGERRSFTVQLLKELYAESDQDALVTRERVTFAPLYPIASNKSTWMGYNIG